MMGAGSPARLEALAPDASSAPIDMEQIRRKREALVRIKRALASLARAKRSVERRCNVSAAEFLESYYAANRPLVLGGLMDGWRAGSRWTAEYLKAACGEEMVEIMASRNASELYEIEDARHRRQVRFAEFVDMVAAGGETNDFYLTARNDFFRRPGARALLADIQPFSEYLRTEDTPDGVYFWFGPRGTVTPLHHDLMNILMAQVQGRKQVKLISPDDIDLVYNHQGVYSLVDCGNPDFERFPALREAEVLEVELAPGDVLFLPVGWWHYVKALDTSITITFNNFRYPNQFEWVHPAAST